MLARRKKEKKSETTIKRENSQTLGNLCTRERICTYNNNKNNIVSVKS